ncbi:MAG: hypothetical protein KKC46_21690 [Proteobacteria bacterium]|nr:hypothetical protein [Pseudomonadota bacterium]
MNLKIIIPFLFVSLYVSVLFAGDGMSSSDVIAIFNKYESLNKEFISSIDTASGAQLRQEAEQYADGPFNQALESAIQIICASENKNLLRALFKVTLATSNSASEVPAWSLGHIFVCKPDLLEKEFKALQKSEQGSLYETHSFGFENVVYERKNENDINNLRTQLHSFALEKLR